MKLIIYRIFSFLLLPVAVIYTIVFLMFIRAAFDNPTMLIPLFLVACVAIYSFASLNFLIRGVDGKKVLGRSSKEWLKVNAIVSSIFALLMISQCIVFILHPEMLRDLAAQAKQNAGADLKINNAAIENYLRVTSYFFLAYSIVLFIHIILSFQYIKLYNYLFQNEKK
jgi:hypothetical protein